MVDYALVGGGGADVALLARIALCLRRARERLGGGLVGVGEVEVGDGAALAAGVVEGLRGTPGAVHVLGGDGARGPRLCLGGAGDDVFSGRATEA